MSVIDHENYFTSLPREYYLDEGRYSDELARVWGQQWIYAGHVSQIPVREVKRRRQTRRLRTCEPIEPRGTRVTERWQVIADAGDR